MIYQIWMMMMVTATVITTFEMPGKRPSNVTPHPLGDNPDASGK